MTVTLVRCGLVVKSEKFLAMVKCFKNVCFNQWPVFLVLPPMLFPAFWFVAATFDWMYGDSGVVLRIYYDSKGELLHEFIADWLASLPMSIAAVWLVLLPMCIFFTQEKCRRLKYPLVTGGLIGLLAGFWLFQLSIPGVLIMTVAGCCLGFGLIIIQWLSAGWHDKS